MNLAPNLRILDDVQGTGSRMGSENGENRVRSGQVHFSWKDQSRTGSNLLFDERAGVSNASSRVPLRCQAAEPLAKCRSGAQRNHTQYSRPRYVN